MKQIIDSIYFDIERRQAIERIYSGDEEDSELVPGKEQLSYTSVEEALEEFQLDVSAPKWFPERYGEFEVTGVVMPGHKFVYVCTLPDQSNFLSFSYEKGEGDSRSVIEKDDNPPILYESGGVQHYLLTDHEWRTAAWMQGDIECVIGGSVTEEEMKRIIDSIYLDGEKEAPSE